MASAGLPGVVKMALLHKRHVLGGPGKVLLGNGGHWFPGLNAARLAEHDLAPCLAGSPFMDQVIQILTEAHQMLAGEERKRLSST